MQKEVYRNTVEFAVRGRYALFSDILTRAGGEKSSYPLPTYEALKGILHSIYWKPTIIWVVDSARIMNPIRTARKGIRPIRYGGGNDLAYYTYLEDVYYQVRAHFEWNMNRPELEKDRNENKHHNIAKRMIERGGRRDIFLGTRECQGYVEPCKFGESAGAYDNCGSIPYGLMYHGITYADEAVKDEDKDMLTVRLWNPVLENGVIDFIRPEECTLKRHIRKMPIKPFGELYDNFTGLDEFVGGDIGELD
ncbi:type I-C CRISPR-associated protein Cas5c [Ruminococcus flavefaciens]|uniref:type I-C CRISPR-associated protein Cas5c n=1 Tax=Ruminococcus flavefaciens TaxID=1265 RepID=UPI0013DD5876|nr:type I-C CRISPR-associated protein Cas5c [Ruminococcus flavefaciens]